MKFYFICKHFSHIVKMLHRPRITFYFLTVKTSLFLSQTSPPHSPAIDVSSNLQQSLPHPPPQRLPNPQPGGPGDPSFCQAATLISTQNMRFYLRLYRPIPTQGLVSGVIKSHFALIQNIPFYRCSIIRNNC